MAITTPEITLANLHERSGPIPTARIRSNGVRLVWYVSPTAREVHVSTAPPQCQIVTMPQELSGGEVLPGFTLALARLFDDSAAS